jgi:hypothetical protein
MNIFVFNLFYWMFIFVTSGIELWGQNAWSFPGAGVEGAVFVSGVSGLISFPGVGAILMIVWLLLSSNRERLLLFPVPEPLEIGDT